MVVEKNISNKSDNKIYRNSNEKDVIFIETKKNILNTNEAEILGHMSLLNLSPLVELGPHLTLEGLNPTLQKIGYFSLHPDKWFPAPHHFRKKYYFTTFKNDF